MEMPLFHVFNFLNVSVILWETSLFSSVRACSELANKRKQTKLLWLQNPNYHTAEEFSNVTCRMFRKKKRDYMKAKVNKLEENSKNKNIWEMYKGINEFKKGY